MDYEVDEEKKTVAPTEEGIAKVEKALGVAEPLRLGRNGLRPPADPGPDGQGAVPPRQGLPRRRRRGEDRRRVHGPHARGAPLGRRHAPGRRGQGAREDQGREPHLGDGHAAELLPPLREARRHDRHRRDRGRRSSATPTSSRSSRSRPTCRASAATRPTSSTRPRTPSSRRSSTTSSSARDAASPSSSAPRRSPSPSTSRGSWTSAACPTRSSTRSSTSARQRSSPRPADPGAVTVATNMAGRGVDIVLGGNAEAHGRPRAAWARASSRDRRVGRGARGRDARAHQSECDKDAEVVREAGGLYVLGSERHESRRIDNQLRGRSGRQGDPGESRFFLSLEDELMRLFATGAVSWVMDRALPDDQPIEAKMVTKAIERAQNTVEGRNAEMRKDVLKYDEVMNEQRKVIYARRLQILDERGPPRAHARAPRRGGPDPRRCARARRSTQRSGTCTASWSRPRSTGRSTLTHRAARRVRHARRAHRGRAAPTASSTTSGTAPSCPAARRWRARSSAT